MVVLGKLVLGGLLLGAAGTDFRRRRIPNRLIIVGLVMFFAVAARLFYMGERGTLAGCLAAGLSAFALHLVPYWFNSMGAGDVKLALITGLLMGWGDWLGYLQVFCLAAMTASGAVLVASRIARKQYAASGPEVAPGCDGVQAAGQHKPRTLPLAPVMAASYILYYVFIILSK